MSTKIEPTLLTFIEELRPLVNNLLHVCAAAPLPPLKGFHFLSRPGLHISPSEDTLRIIDIYYPDKPLLSLSIGPPSLLNFNVAVSIETYHKTSWGGTSHFLNIYEIDSEICNATPPNSIELFAHAKEVLSFTASCIQKGEPLEKNLSWPQVLRHHLEMEDPIYFELFRWDQWVSTWGTPEMKTVLDIANSIINSDKNLSEWRLFVTTHWKNLEHGNPALNSGISLPPAEYGDTYSC